MDHYCARAYPVKRLYRFLNMQTTSSLQNLENIADQPLVSAIIIFLNAEKFLQEAIQSVLAQSYKNWELLLVDDGSQDQSAAIALGYAKEFPGQVFYFAHPSQQNRGMSASRNLGIQRARGKFIAFLDADDLWVSNILEEQVSLLDSHPEAVMVHGPIRYWFSWTGRPEDQERDYVESLGVLPNTLHAPPGLLPLFLQNKATVPSGGLIRREIIDKVGGFEDTFLNFYEDQVFCAKVSLVAPIYSVGECWYWYRQHPESSCMQGKRSGEYYSARKPFLDWLKDYLVRQNVDDPHVWRALEHELQPYHHPTRYRVGRLVRSYMKRAQQLTLAIVSRILPVSIRGWLKTRWQAYQGLVPVGSVNFGNLRRLMPVSRHWGFERGLPVDRYYIEQFLSANAKDIQGRVLEILDDAYTHQFGGDRVSQRDVLHIKAGNPKATLIGDLTGADHLPSDAFDCIIITQTIHLIYDVHAAIRTLYRILKPGGVLLATVPGVSQISRYDMDRWGDYWRFTTRSSHRLFAECFPADSVQIVNYGNVLTATAFLYGLATQELRSRRAGSSRPRLSGSYRREGVEA